MPNEELRITVTAKADQAERELRDIENVADELSKDDIDLIVRARTEATEAELKRLRKLMGTLSDPIDIKVASQGIDRAEAQLRDLDKLGGSTASSFGDMADAAGSLPGPLGEVAGMLGGGGGIAAGAAAVATSMIAAATSFADSALDAQALQVAVGGTTEETSRLLAATKNVGLDYNDLQEIISESNRAMQANTEEARMLGVNLAGTPLERFQELAEAVYKIPDPLERAAAASKFFGEEGSKQMARLVAGAGSVTEALEKVPDSLVMSAEDIANAQEFTNAWQGFKAQAAATGAEVGRAVLPALTAVGQRAEDAAEDVSWLSKQWKSVEGWRDPGYKVSELLGWRDAADDTGEVVEELAVSMTALAERTTASVEAGQAAKAAWDEQVAGLEEMKAATDEARGANEELRDSLFTSADAGVEAGRTWSDLNDEVGAFGKLATPTRADVERLNDSVFTYADAQVAAAGTTRDTTAGSKLYKDALLVAAGVLGDQMNPELQAYIDKALAVPDTAVTDIRGDLDPTEFNEADRLADQMDNRTVHVKFSADYSEVLAAQSALVNYQRLGGSRATQSSASRYVWRNGHYVEV